MDSGGDAVSVTTTINSAFGSRVVVAGAGFLLNNEMDDFSAKPGSPNQFGLIGGEANAIAPGKRMLSSMTPTIVLKDGKPYIVIGSPGGSTIITTVLQVIVNTIDFGMNIRQAIDAPRFHHQWLPDHIDYEECAITKDVRENLEKMGYHFGMKRSLGLAEGIIWLEQEQLFTGWSDGRGNGLAEGY
jgi:gamma-glutamyltranspeptidase/glutathione hydrolase